MKNYRSKNSTIKFGRSRLLVLALCSLCVLCGQSYSQDFKTLQPGIEYAEVTKEISGLKVNMNLLRLDLTKVRLDVHHAFDKTIGVDTTSNIAMQHGAFAAINAGFFRLDNSVWAGDPAGVLMIDGELLSEPSNDRIQLFISNERSRTNVLFERIDISEAVRFGKETVKLAGINRERKKDDLVMYTPEFGRTTLTDNNGIEVVVVSGLVASVTRDLGNSVIPPNGFVVSASGTSYSQLSDAYRGESLVRIRRQWTGLPDMNMDNLSDLDIVAGVPQLIKNGKIDITWEQEKSSRSFVETRHPRTAVAKLKDGKFLMITVDGRTESSGGIGLQDLAEYLLSLGATDAMNLDGGGSTTMFVDGKVVNHPSDKEGERKVSDAILVTPRHKK